MFGYQVRIRFHKEAACAVYVLLTGRYSLAYMEMYMAIAYFIRRFELVPVGTTAKDMVWDDMVIPQFHGEFKVTTKRRTD